VSDEQVAQDTLANTGPSQHNADVARRVIDDTVPIVEDVTEDSDDEE